MQICACNCSGCVNMIGFSEKKLLGRKDSEIYLMSQNDCFGTLRERDLFEYRRF